MRVFILAGGFATRLWPLTEHRPKPLLPIAGKPIITHLLEKLPAQMPVTVSTNAVFEDAFRGWLTSIGRPNVSLLVEGTRSDDHKLGALGAIAQWVEREHVDDDLLILTGDNYLGFSLDRFLETFTGNPLLAAHDIGDLERAKAFGVVSVTDGKISAFHEKPASPDSTLISTGCVVLPKDTLPVLLEFAALKPDNLGGIFEEFLRRHIMVDCFTFTEPWMDIGSFQSYMEAHRMLVGHKAVTEPSARIAQTECGGSVTVGKNCAIEGSELTDCMIFENVNIRNCTLRECVIDDDCVLEGVDLKGKMLRKGTRLIV